MDYDHIRIKLEQEIGKNLWELLEGEVISKIKGEAKVEKSGYYYKYLLEGHSFKLGPDLLPDLYRPFKDVCEALNFTEPVEFYISNALTAMFFSGSSILRTSPFPSIWLF